MSERRSCLYVGAVTHRRHRPRRHDLAYRVYAVYVDLDELSDLDCRLFAHDRFSLLSLLDRDHGDGRAGGLKDWALGQLARAGIDTAGVRVGLLCYPRVLGYVFNPLSVFYFEDTAGRIIAVLYEVNNTFGQRHGYLIPLAEPCEADAMVRQACEKSFYVSPFIAVTGGYRFRWRRPGARYALSIEQGDADGPLLTATFAARRVPLDDRTILSVFLRHPLVTLKVIGAIHWEALKLWSKGIALHPRPEPPREPVSIHWPDTNPADGRTHALSA